MTYTYCKKVIANKTYLSKDAMLEMLDVFLLNGRITTEQYNELVALTAAE